MKRGVTLCLLLFISILNVHTALAGYKWVEMPADKYNYDYTSVFFLDEHHGFLVGYSDDENALLQFNIGTDSMEIKVVDTFMYWGTPTPIMSFINKSTGWIATNDPYRMLLKTSDSGKTFTEFDNNIMKFGSVSNLVFIDSTTGWATSGLKLIKTTDGGINWFVVDSTIRWYDFRNLYFLNPDTSWIFKDYGAELMTKDGWKTWSVPDDWEYEHFYSVLFTDSLNGWKMGTHIHKTTDGGSKWVNKRINGYDDSHGGGFSKGFFLDSDHGWIFGGEDSYCYKTKDGGDNWIREDLPFEFFASNIQYYFINDSTGYAFGSEGMVFRYRKEGPDAVGETLSAAQETSITVSPNPAGDVIAINVEGKEMEESINLYDINGNFIACLYTGIIGQGSRIEVKLSEYRLADGVYYIVTSGKNFRGGVKVVYGK